MAALKKLAVPIVKVRRNGHVAESQRRIGSRHIVLLEAAIPSGRLTSG